MNNDKYVYLLNNKKLDHGNWKLAYEHSEKNARENAFQHCAPESHNGETAKLPPNSWLDSNQTSCSKLKPKKDYELIRTFSDQIDIEFENHPRSVAHGYPITIEVPSERHRSSQREEN